MYFLAIKKQKKGYKCYHLTSKKKIVYKDATFVENQSFFGETYLQGENSLEDKFGLTFGFDDLDVSFPKSNILYAGSQPPTETLLSSARPERPLNEERDDKTERDDETIVPSILKKEKV